MPKIPRFVGSKTISGEAANVQVNPTAFGSGGQAAQDVGNVLGQIAEKMAQVNDAHQTAQADTYATAQMLDWTQNMSRDQDLNTIMPRTEEQFKDIREEAGNKISSPLVRSQFFDTYNKKAVLTASKIGIDAQNRRISKAQSDTFVANDVTIEAIHNTDIPGEKAVLQREWEQRTRDMMAIGVIDHELGENYIKKTKASTANEEVRRDGDLSVDLALEGLAKGEDGPYANVPVAQRRELKNEMLAKKEKQRVVAERQLKVDQEEALTRGLFIAWDENHDLSVTTIEEWMDSGVVSRAGGEKLRTYVLNPNVDTETKNLVMIDTLERFADLVAKGDDLTLEEIVGFRSKMLDDANAKRLGMSDHKTFYKATMQSFNKKFKKDVVDPLLAEKYPANWMVRLFDKVNVWYDRYSDIRPEAKAAAYKLAFDQLEGGIEFKKALENVNTFMIENDLHTAMEATKAPIPAFQANVDKDRAGGKSDAIIAEELREAGLIPFVYGVEPLVEEEEE